MSRRINCLIYLTVIGLSGCLGAVKELYPPAKTQSSVRIYVVGHGWHTGLVLPLSEIPQELWPEKSDFDTFDYVEVGWGDEGFYTAQRITLGVSLRAIFIPTPSVLHIVGVEGTVADYFAQSDIVELKLSEKGFIKLCEYVDASFYRRDKSRAQPLRLGIYGESYFYRAKGYYYFPKTCNVWTARTLRQAGCPITPLYALTSSNLISQAKRAKELAVR